MLRTDTPESARLLEQFDAGLIVSDATGSVVVWNDGATEILGLDAADAIGRRWPDLITIVHGGVTTAREVLGAASLPGGWHGLAECQVVSGRTVRVRVHLQRVRDPMLGRGRGYMAIFWAARDPGRHLRKATGGVKPVPYRMLFQRSPEPLALATMGGELLDVNDAAADLFGWRREDAIGKRYSTAFEDWTEAEERACYESLVAQGFFLQRAKGRHLDGTTFPIEMAATLMSTRDGEYIFAVLRDLSPEDRLERVIEDLGDLARLSETPRETGEVAARALSIVSDAFRAENAAMILAANEAAGEKPQALVATGTPEVVGATLAATNRGRPALVRRMSESDGPFHVLLPGGAQDAPWGAKLVGLGIQTLWGVPITFGQETIGGLVLLWRSRAEEPFDHALLDQMGRLIGLAIGNAGLREQMRLGAERRAALEGSARVSGAVVAQMTDPLVTTDRDGCITGVNPAAVRSYGFATADVVGRKFDDVIETLRLDGAPLGNAPTREALTVGHWHGRVIHRPRIGTQAGRSAIFDLSLTAIRDEQREFIGMIALSREMTASARLESEAAALSSLAVATGRARSRREIAEGALERLCEATGTESGMIVSLEGERFAVDAARGISDKALESLRDGPAARKLRRRLQEPGSILSGRLFDSVIDTMMPRAIVADGVKAGVVAGLRVRGELIGFIALGSSDPAWSRPSDDVVLQAAAQVATALENASLVERLEGGLQHEQRLTNQLETLVGLTQLPHGGEITQQRLADFLLERIMRALDALAGYVVVPNDDNRFTLAAARAIGTADEHKPKLFLNLEIRERETFYFWRRLLDGSGPFVAPIDEHTVLPSVLNNLLDQGYRSFAGFPVRDGGRLVAAFVCHFPWLIGDAAAPADQRTLEAVGRIIEIAYTNIRMGEGLAAAVERQRRLGAELHALQDLTLLGATSDDLPTLARDTITSVVAATGASGGGYILADEASRRLDPIAWVGRRPSSGPAAQPARDGSWRELDHLRSGEHICVCAPEPPASEVAQAVLPLRLNDGLMGALQLVWSDAPKEEFDLHFLEPIARIATISLANFRLRSELLERASAQRALGQRLDALDELTRIGEEASSFEELVHRTANLVRDALGATGLCFLLLEPGHHFETLAVAGETGAFRGWLKGIPARDAPGGGALLSGAGSVLADFSPGDVDDRVLPIARADGFRSFGAIPIRNGEELTGALLCLFDRRLASLPIDDAALDSVARIAGIALANFLLRERLVLSEERYRTLFEESPEAMLVAALDGTVLDANEAAVRLYRMDRGEVLGRYFGQLTSSDERELARRRQIVWAQGRGTFRDRGRRQDGSEFPVEIEIRVVELGGQRRFLSLMRDLSDQERLQRELLQAQKMEALGQLVSGVAHELNNPLTAIIAFSQLLSRDERLPDDMRHPAGLLVQEADRTRRIVQNLLDFARQRPPERQPTRIAVLVQSVLELQSYALSANRIEVSKTIPDDLPEVDLDRAQLQQVLLNLTINAIQAIRTLDSSGMSHLTIAAESIGPAPAASGRRAGTGERMAMGPRGDGRDGRDGRVRITITDDGPGVPTTARARLFDPFFTTKQPGEGTGLGLSVSFGIVAAHDGQLWYEPGPGGVGSSFIIELPVRARGHDDRRPLQALEAGIPTPATATPVSAAADAPQSRGSAVGAARSPAGTSPGTGADAGTAPSGSAVPAASAASIAGPQRPAAGSARTGRPRILVLDDESSIRDLLTRALGVAGMEVRSFHDGGEALDHLDTASVDVMLIDHRMAGMSGTEFYEAAIKAHPELVRRAVFMSGDTLNPDLRTFATKQGIRLLAKPFDIDAVTRVVRESLASSGN